MATHKIDVKCDNSHPELKAELRQRFLPANARVLDLFCGTGQMYNLAYKDHVDHYVGVDKVKVHDPRICRLMDNRKFVKTQPLDEYNVYDLDAYGCPWSLFWKILEKIPPGKYTFYMTDGTPLHLKMDDKVTRNISATEGLPRSMKIRGLYYYYLDIFNTMLLKVSEKFNLKISPIHYFRNEYHNVYYAHIPVEKLKV